MLSNPISLGGSCLLLLLLPSLRVIMIVARKESDDLFMSIMIVLVEDQILIRHDSQSASQELRGCDSVCVHTGSVL